MIQGRTASQSISPQSLIEGQSDREAGEREKGEERAEERKGVRKKESKRGKLV